MLKISVTSKPVKVSTLYYINNNCVCCNSYELSLVSEQLSAQHARVVSLEKNPAGLTMDEVIKERLVEQQLKLKQVRV